jgi:hypothetical protein
VDRLAVVIGSFTIATGADWGSAITAMSPLLQDRGSGLLHAIAGVARRLDGRIRHRGRVGGFRGNRDGGNACGR